MQFVVGLFHHASILTYSDDDSYPPPLYSKIKYNI